MKKILQITVMLPPSFKTDELVWMDIMEFPPTINDFREVLEKAKDDFPNRQVRIIEILEDQRQ